MTSAANKEFLAVDAYSRWRRLVRTAEQSVRIYSPYLDDLAVRLLGNAQLDPEDLSVVTDLSPESGTLSYRRQLLAIRRLLNQGIEVRSLPRLHAKVLLTDGAQITVGSQNFTFYARTSRETTVVPELAMSESRFVHTLDAWYEKAKPVDLELVERLLADLAEPLAAVRLAIEALTTAYEQAAADYHVKRRLAAQRRFERDLALARATTTTSGIRRAAAASTYSAGQSVAYARLEMLDAGYSTLKGYRDVDLTHWRMAVAGQPKDTVRLARLAFYPVLLAPDGRMAFVRVAASRITYVWHGVRWGGASTIGGRRVYMTTSFPPDQDDQANLVITFGWEEGAATGYQMRLRFDGDSVLPVAEGTLLGGPRRGAELATLIAAAYEDRKAWDEVLRTVFSPVRYPRGFRDEKNAAKFFPTGWLRIDHTKFLGESVLLIQPHE